MKLLLDQNLSFRFLDQLSDFYELALARGIPPKIVWLRCGNVSNRYLLALLLKAADTIAAFIEEPESTCLELP